MGYHRAGAGDIQSLAQGARPVGKADFESGPSIPNAQGRDASKASLVSGKTRKKLWKLKLKNNQMNKNIKITRAVLRRKFIAIHAYVKKISNQEANFTT